MIPASFHIPVESTQSAVIVHTISVSTVTSNTPQSPCLTGWSVLAVACAIGEVPIPASFEYTPRAAPHLSALAVPAPANPPTAAVPVNAPWKMLTITPGRAAAFTNITTNAPSMYTQAIIGTKLSVTFTKVLNPPIATINTITKIIPAPI